MANSTNTEPAGTKTAVSLSIDRDVLASVTKLAEEEGRSISNMAERLFRTHPQVQEAQAGVATA